MEYDENPPTRVDELQPGDIFEIAGGPVVEVVETSPSLDANHLLVSFQVISVVAGQPLPIAASGGQVTLSKDLMIKTLKG